MRTFKMPSLGADMEEGTLVEWTVKPGEQVKRGDIVAVVETQKGAIEIEIFEEGTISRLLAEPGETLPVGAPLAELDGEGAAEGKETEEKPAEMPAPEADRKPAPPPPAKAEAAERPPPPAAAEASSVRASPAAKALAAERGIDLAGVEGSGPEGAVTRADVEAAVKPAEPAAAERGQAPPPPARKGIDLGEMRKAIAAAMARSKREIPHYYLSHTIDMRTAARWLEETNADRAPADRLLMGALLLKATALALTRFSELNGHYEDGAFTPAKAVHLGMAVAIRGGGLIAPAIRDADRLSLDRLMTTMRDLVARVRAGRLRSSELTDGGSKVTSLGERGVDAVYGVIYPPQVSIVGFGAVAERPLVGEEGLEAAPCVTATLAADHRVSDGRRGALFLREIEKLLQVPEAL